MSEKDARELLLRDLLMTAIESKKKITFWRTFCFVEGLILIIFSFGMVLLWTGI